MGMVGTSLGSCYAFLASVHDPRIEVNVFNHCSTYFADVVWEGFRRSTSARAWNRRSRSSSCATPGR